LAEIEHFARQCLAHHNAVALAITNATGNVELALVVESERVLDTQQLLSHLRTKLPSYMIPSVVRYVPSFPLNSNGKTDRKSLMQELAPTAQ
ncbi:MAG: hypothetical protein IPG92_12000, partial [Flavobacteriales bacterium]|nr:hypothetical protein [Flavobacteriales bacterium]